MRGSREPDFKASQKAQHSLEMARNLVLPFACCSPWLSVHHGWSLAAGAAAAGAAEDAAADPDEAAGAAGPWALALLAAASAAAVNLPADPRGVSFAAGSALTLRFAAGAALSLRLAAPWIVGTNPAPR